LRQQKKAFDIRHPKIKISVANLATPTNSKSLSRQ
jgi:hypothetical protein